ncbi:heme-binding protein [Streptomyces sp. NPDC056161]|uniref:GlcG/HbpS family heme-binding protein n=1 Tax=Streptomyces sp. NPDC056161 TaxID=3345732 RepID=UPI0035D97429
MASRLSLSQAAGIVDAALERARRLDHQPLSVVVLDAGGHVLVAEHEPGTGILMTDFAHAKAWGPLGLGRGGGRLASHADRDPLYIPVMASVSGGRVTGSRGGVLIRTAGGEIVGSVGVSGDHADENDACAVHAIEQAGFVADAGRGDRPWTGAAPELP